jgi:hypothetical protein
MRRPDPPVDPEVTRELAELEAALAGDVRAVAARPDPAFLARLEERVAGGLPRAERRRWPWRPAMALPVAACVLAAAVVAGAVLRGEGDGAPVPEAAVQRSGGEAAAAGTQLTAPDLARPAAPAAGDTAAARRVERGASVTLAPPAGDVEEAADGVARAATALGGYVATSQVSTDGDGGSASLQLRVPSARLTELLARLRDLAPVAAQTQAATDITGATGAAAGRVADARAERRALLRALGRATTEAEIAALRARLRVSRARVTAAERALAELRRRGDLATVDVAVRAAREEAGGPWTPGDALRDARRVLELATGVLLVGAAVLVPLALVLAPAVVLARATSRRRRERALAGV